MNLGDFKKYFVSVDEGLPDMNVVKGNKVLVITKYGDLMTTDFDIEQADDDCYGFYAEYLGHWTSYHNIPKDFVKYWCYMPEYINEDWFKANAL